MITPINTPEYRNSMTYILGFLLTFFFFFGMLEINKKEEAV